MGAALAERVQKYWNEHVHDMAMVKHPVGSEGFFSDLEEYRFDKNRYLLSILDFGAFKERKVLEVGCGVGIDLAKFAEAGAEVTGIDISEMSVGLAHRNFELRGLKPDIRVMDVERLEFGADTFDVVYGHGLLPYVDNVQQAIDEVHRVLKPGGEAILQVYNRRSWLYVLSKVMNTKLEHQDAPAFHIESPREFRRMLAKFKRCELILERFPVKTRLHTGLKGSLYNSLFVGAFNSLPRAWVRPLGWHMIARATK